MEGSLLFFFCKLGADGDGGRGFMRSTISGARTDTKIRIRIPTPSLFGGPVMSYGHCAFFLYTTLLLFEAYRVHVVVREGGKRVVTRIGGSCQVRRGKEGGRDGFEYINVSLLQF